MLSDVADGDRRRGKHQAGGLDEQRPGGHRQYPAAARREHLQVVDRIKKLLPQLKATLPSSIEVSVLTDRTTTIRASVEDVQFELMLTVALVVHGDFSLLAELSRRRSFPSVAVPLSLVGTFGVMYLLGYSLTISR